MFKICRQSLLQLAERIAEISDISTVRFILGYLQDTPLAKVIKIFNAWYKIHKQDEIWASFENLEFAINSKTLKEIQLHDPKLCSNSFVISSMSNFIRGLTSPNKVIIQININNNRIKLVSVVGDKVIDDNKSINKANLYTDRLEINLSKCDIICKLVSEIINIEVCIDCEMLVRNTSVSYTHRYMKNGLDHDVYYGQIEDGIYEIILYNMPETSKSKSKHDCCISPISNRCSHN